MKKDALGRLDESPVGVPRATRLRKVLEDDGFEGLKRNVPPGAVAGLYDNGMHSGGWTGAPQTTLPGGAGSSPFGQQAQQQSQAKPPSWSSSAFDQARSLGN